MSSFCPKNFGKAIYNIVIMRHSDNFMRRLQGQDWIDKKNKKAVARTHNKLGID
jgi:hypothetical protein